jgi:hypothetical protein
VPPEKSESTVRVIPPLLTERDAPNEPSVDFRAQIAQERLKEARQFHAEHPQETPAYQRTLNDILRASNKMTYFSDND